MSAKSRAKKHYDLPLHPGDYIVAMGDCGDYVLVSTAHGRAFTMTRVPRYKRQYKIHEVTAQRDEESSESRGK